MKRLLIACLLSLGLATLAASTSTEAMAQAQNFYAGKTIRLIVGFPPGGAFDRTMRLLAEHMPNHIPGKPNMIVENMPGADSIVAANYIFNVAPKDGTVFAAINGGLTTLELIGQEGIAFKSEQFNWVGALLKSRIVCFVAKSTGVASMDDLVKPRAKPVVVGALGPATQKTTIATFLKMVGGQVKVATGYPGTNQIYLAMEQGESDATCGVWEGMKVTAKPLLDTGKFTVFMQDGDTKAADLPDAQLFVETLKNPTHKALWTGLTRSEAITRPSILPPGVPADRVAIIRKAYAETMKDPAFMAAMAKTGDELNPSTGEEVLTVVKQIMATPPELRGELKKLLTAE